MAYHLAAYYQSLQSVTAGSAVNAVPDQTIFTTGADIRVPDGLNYLVGAAALLNDASFTQAQLQSPTLRMLANYDIEPFVTGAAWTAGKQFPTMFESPLELTPTEALNLYTMGAPASAVAQYGLVMLGDGPIKKTSGKMFSIRATGAAALAAGAWVNTAVTFDQKLPAGDYQVVGFRPRGANLVAARMVFIGGIWRPGAPGVPSLATSEFDYFRHGNAGVLGQFNTDYPLTVDCLGQTDTAQTFIFDLIKVK